MGEKILTEKEIEWLKQRTKVEKIYLIIAILSFIFSFICLIVGSKLSTYRNIQGYILLFLCGGSSFMALRIDSNKFMNIITDIWFLKRGHFHAEQSILSFSLHPKRPFVSPDMIKPISFKP